MKRKNILSIIFDITSILIYSLISLWLFDTIKTLNIYYTLSITPLFIITIILAINHTIKFFFSVIVMIFGRNDNTEVTDNLLSKQLKINNIIRITLVIIFLIQLFITMILDIILCITKEKYLLLSFSLVVWILLIYFLIKAITSKQK